MTLFDVIVFILAWSNFIIPGISFNDSLSIAILSSNIEGSHNRHCGMEAYRRNCLVASIYDWPIKSTALDHYDPLICCTMHWLSNPAIVWLNQSLSWQDPYSLISGHSGNEQSILPTVGKLSRIEAKYEHIGAPMVLSCCNSGVFSCKSLIQLYALKAGRKIILVAHLRLNPFRSTNHTTIYPDHSKDVQSSDSLLEFLAGLSGLLDQKNLLNLFVFVTSTAESSNVNDAAFLSVPHHLVHPKVTIIPHLARPNIYKGASLPLPQRPLPKDPYISCLLLSRRFADDSLLEVIKLFNLSGWSCVDWKDDTPAEIRRTHLPTFDVSVGLHAADFISSPTRGSDDSCTGPQLTAWSVPSPHRLSWVAEALLRGSIPILLDRCLYDYLRRQKDSKSWPILFITAPKLLKALSDGRQSLVTLLDVALKDLHDSKHRNAFSLSSLYLPYWLHRLLPFNATDAHISRGISRHQALLTRLKTWIGPPTTCPVTPTSGRVATSVPPSLTVTSSISGDIATSPLVEFVLPRCCESVAGDLAWLPVLLSQCRGACRAAIYYKCPWCLPENKVDEWVQLVRDDPKLLAFWNRSSSSNRRSSASSSQSHSLRLQRVGIDVIDAIAVNGVQEYPAFDREVNGKEATAYLSHILQRYSDNGDESSKAGFLGSMADFTFFLHTQPAHHLDAERFIRSLSYFTSPCRRQDQIQNQRQSTRKFTARVKYPDFVYLNYRWMSGHWAHQPEQCALSLLEFAFANGTQWGDSKRYQPSWRRSQSAAEGLAQFLAVPMASGVAAQFVVPRAAVQRRSLAWWKKLLDVNRGYPPLKGCNHRTYIKGSEVASAMERLWHNFFRDGTSLANPLFLPNATADNQLPDILRIESPSNPSSSFGSGDSGGSGSGSSSGSSSGSGSGSGSAYHDNVMAAAESGYHQKRQRVSHSTSSANLKRNGVRKNVPKF